MASIQELKSRIDLHDLDLHDLAARLGMMRGKGGNANYHSPHHRDKSPSLFIDTSGKSFRDFSAEGVPYAKGSCVDLLMYVKGLSEVGDAMKWLHEEYGIPFDATISTPVLAPTREKSRAEFIAERCLADPSPVHAYLNGRGISDEVVDAAIRNKTLGFNHWTSGKIAQGQCGYGGEAAAFIVRHPLSVISASVISR